MTKATTIIAAALLIAVGAHAQTDIQALKVRAEQGFARAQFALGLAYSNGEGVPQSDVEATRWWTKAAEQGNDLAQFGLGLAYYSGKGVPQNYAKAYMWLSLAKAGEANLIRESREIVDEALDVLTSDLLTPG